TNDVAKGVQTASKGTNGVGAARDGGAPSSNAVAGVKSNKGAQKGGGPEMAMMGMNAMMGGPMGRPGGKKGPDLPPAIQARVDKITDSEMLGPIMHPLPMALLGIAGKLAFLRAPSGQTGAVKEGDEVGGLKLLRIGTNRVLVEHEGQKKELTIFSGYGSETLLEKERPNENTTTNKSR